MTQNLPKRKMKTSALICSGNILTQHKLIPVLLTGLTEHWLLTKPMLLSYLPDWVRSCWHCTGFPNYRLCNTAYSDRNWLIFCHAVCNMSAKEYEVQFVIARLIKHGHFQGSLIHLPWKLDGHKTHWQVWDTIYMYMKKAFHCNQIIFL